jgi:hypothetical protein
MTRSIVVLALLAPAISLAGQTSQQTATTPPPAPTNRWSPDPALKRQDYGISLNRFMEGAQIVGDDVRITIDVEATERATTR